MRSKNGRPSLVKSGTRTEFPLSSPPLPDLSEATDQTPRSSSEHHPYSSMPALTFLHFQNQCWRKFFQFATASGGTYTVAMTAPRIRPPSGLKLPDSAPAGLETQLLADRDGCAHKVEASRIVPLLRRIRKGWRPARRSAAAQAGSATT